MARWVRVSFTTGAVRSAIVAIAGLLVVPRDASARRLGMSSDSLRPMRVKAGSRGGHRFRRVWSVF